MLFTATYAFVYNICFHIFFPFWVSIRMGMKEVNFKRLINFAHLQPLTLKSVKYYNSDSIISVNGYSLSRLSVLMKRQSLFEFLFGSILWQFETIKNPLFRNMRLWLGSNFFRQFQGSSWRRLRDQTAQEKLLWNGLSLL
jgi:hypothetical protein